jgi:hypothetical protein
MAHSSRGCRRARKADSVILLGPCRRSAAVHRWRRIAPGEETRAIGDPHAAPPRRPALDREARSTVLLALRFHHRAFPVSFVRTSLLTTPRPALAGHFHPVESRFCRTRRFHPASRLTCARPLPAACCLRTYLCPLSLCIAVTGPVPVGIGGPFPRNPECAPRERDGRSLSSHPPKRTLEAASPNTGRLEMKTVARRETCRGRTGT